MSLLELRRREAALRRRIAALSTAALADESALERQAAMNERRQLIDRHLGIAREIARHERGRAQAAALAEDDLFARACGR